jgi:hypothetical protein
VAVLNPAFAAAMAGTVLRRDFMYNLVWQSVVSARQVLILLVMKNQMLRPTAPTARRTSVPLGKTRRRGWPDYGRATPSLRQPTPGAFSS